MIVESHLFSKKDEANITLEGLKTVRTENALPRKNKTRIQAGFNTLVSFCGESIWLSFTKKSEAKQK